MNKKWVMFKEKFLPIFDTFDLKELNRVDLVKRKSIELNKAIKKFYKTGIEIPVSQTN